MAGAFLFPGVGVDLDALLPAYLAARLVGVSKQTFRKWTLRPVNPLRRATDEHGRELRDERGHPVYRARDVLAVERETRRSLKSSRYLPTAA